MRRALRIIRKLGLGLLLLVVVVVGGALIFIHTNTGREVVRDKLEAQLKNTFTGDVRVGKLEGSPFGTYVLREVVIDGPDGQPAVEIGKLSVSLELAGLVRQHAVITKLVVEDASVHAKRMPDGSLSLAHLMRPGPKSAWTVSIRDLAVHRSSFELVDEQPVHLDNIEIDGGLDMAGDVLGASASLSATWKERAVPLRAVLSVKKTAEGIEVPAIAAFAGDVSLHAASVRVNDAGFGGTGVVRATQKAVAALAPEVQLPADVEMGFEATAPATSSDPSHVKLAGTLGGDKITGDLDIWIEAKRIAGALSAPDLHLAKLTGGKVAARGGGSVELDMRMADAQLPIGRFSVNAQGVYQDFPRTSLVISGSSDGDSVRGAVEATNPGLAANVAGELAFAGERITLTSATVTARSSNLAAASGKTVPLRGTLAVDLAAHGQLRPKPILAVAGTIDGKKIAVLPQKRGEPSPLKLETLAIKIDGKRLPEKPYGRFELIARDLQGPQFAMRELTLKAADRADGAIQATLRTYAKRDPWLFEADALIRPGKVTTVDLQRHLVRAGAGTEWRGTSGRVTIAQDRIELRDLATASKDGALALAGSYQRTGRRAGDITAKLDATTLALANIDPKYTGTVDAHVDMTRTGGVVRAEADVKAHDISIVPPRPKTVPKAAVLATAPSQATPPRKPAAVPRTADGTPVDGKSKIAANNGQGIPLAPPVKTGDKPPAKQADIPSRSVTAAAKVEPRAGQAPAGVPAGADSAGTAAERERRAPGFDATAKIKIDGSHAAIDAMLLAGTGNASLAVEIDGPAQITEAAAWRRAGREVIKTATIRLRKFQLGPAMKTVGIIGEYGGTVDGVLSFAGTPTGELRLRGLMAPELRGLGAVNADLRLAARGDELLPTITARLDRIGSIQAAAEIQPPERLFDPKAWQALGRGVVRHATVKARDLAIDPGRLEQLGIVATARGRVSFDVDVIPERAKLDVLARDLRGSPVSDPIDAELHAVIGRTTDAAFEVKLDGQSMFEATAAIPVSFDQLIKTPNQLRGLPLSGSGRLDIAANRLLGVFGRREITGGQIDGSVLISGTVGAPTAVATIVGTNIDVPPGPGGKPVQRVERIAIDLVWENNRGALIIEGKQQQGRLLLAANASPGALDQGTMTLSAKGFDLLPVLAFAPGPAGGAAGTLDAELKIKGFDPKTMQVAGTMKLREGRIPLAPNVGTLRRAAVDLSIKDRIITVALDGRLGGGTVRANGSASLDGGLPSGGEIAMRLRDVSPIGVVEPIVDADVTIKLRREDLKWLADIDVRGGKVVVPKRRGEALAPAGAPPDMVFVTGERMTRRPMEKASPEKPTLVANITIAATKVESEELRGIIRGKLQVTADANAIGMLGSIEADRGDLDLFGRRYRVERAGVRFDGGIDPILDIELVYDFPEVTTITEVRGRLSKPKLIMRSNPGTYSQGQLLGFLLGGEPTGEPGDARDRATSAGTSFVANQIGGYVKKALPIDIDVLRYEAATASSSAAITVGTWLRHGLFLAYRQRLEARPDENSGEGELEYWLSRRVVIEAVVGDRNKDSVDLLWRKRY